MSVYRQSDALLSGRIRSGDALRRRVRAQIIRQPLRFNVVVFLQTLDPLLADIAPWSDVVGKHLYFDKTRRLSHDIPPVNGATVDS